MDLAQQSHSDPHQARRLADQDELTTRLKVSVHVSHSSALPKMVITGVAA